MSEIGEPIREIEVVPERIEEPRRREKELPTREPEKLPVEPIPVEPEEVPAGV